jgi:transposase-like protein
MSTTNQRRASKEQFWRTVLKRWRSSGLSVRAYCDEHGLAEPTFYAWRRMVAERDAAAVRFVPAQVVAESRPQVGVDGLAGALELVLGAGHVLRVGPGFDGPTLKRLLALLEEGQP